MNSSRFSFFLLALVLSIFSLDSAFASVYVYPDGSTATFDDTAKLNAMCSPQSWGSRSSTTPTLSSTVCTNAQAFAVVSWPSSNACGTFHICDVYTPPPPPCPAAGTAAIPSGQVGYGESAAGSNPVNAVLCGSNSCVIEVQAANAIPIGGGMQGNYITQARYTGAHIATGTNCPLIVTAPSPNDPSLPKPIDTVTPNANTADGVPAKASDCPAGSAFGQVNGVNVCAPSGSKISYVPESTTVTQNGSNYSSSTQKTQTVNDDGSVTTTTTVSGTGPDGTTSSSSTTTGDGGRNGLSGNDANSGNGNQDKGIDLGPAPLPLSGDTPTLSGLTPGTGADGQGGAAKVFSVGSSFAGASGCIADRSVNVLGLTITVPLSQVCPYLDTIYKIVSLFAVFAALRILVM